MLQRAHYFFLFKMEKHFSVMEVPNFLKEHKSNDLTPTSEHYFDSYGVLGGHFTLI